MKKTVLLIGYNFYPEPTGIGKYSGEQIQWLVKNGYDCTVITSYPYYPYWKVQEPYYKNRFWYMTETEEHQSGGRLTVHRCPMYVPSRPSGFSRIVLDFTFMVSAFFKLLQLLFHKKMDFVIAVVPSFLIGLLGILYKETRASKLLYHIHDMQIEAARDLKMIKSKRVIDVLFKIESFILDRCDMITCVGEGMLRRTQEKINKKISLFLNATDLNQFYPIKDRDALKKKFGFQPSDKIILYSGGIGEKQGIEYILYAAEHFKENKEMKFVICGSGPYKQKLMSFAETLKLPNVIFLPLQPLECFNQFLNAADVHLVVQKANAGDLVMPSKLTTVLAIGGLAVVTANEGSGMHALLKEHKMGLLAEAENQHSLNEAIYKAVTEDSEEICRNAIYYAESHLSIERIMRNFEVAYLGKAKSGLITKQQPVVS